MTQLPPKNPNDIVVFGDKWDKYIKWSHAVSQFTTAEVVHYKDENPGWSVRIMFRDNTALTSFKFERELDAYAEMHRIVTAMNETMQWARDQREQLITALKDILGADQVPNTTGPTTLQ